MRWLAGVLICIVVGMLALWIVAGLTGCGPNLEQVARNRNPECREVRVLEKNRNAIRVRLIGCPGEPPHDVTYRAR